MDLQKIGKYFAQSDTPEFKIHDRNARQLKITEIHKIINKWKPQSYVLGQGHSELGGIFIVRIISLKSGYSIIIESINAKDPHGIELLTLNQLEWLEKILKTWEKNHKVD